MCGVGGLVRDNLVDFTSSHLCIGINHDVIVVDLHVLPVLLFQVFLSNKYFD